MSFSGKTILINGGARRVGRSLVLAAACAGADVFLYYYKSETEVERLRDEVTGPGRQSMLLKAHVNKPQQSMDLIARARRQAELFAVGAILPAETETPEVPLDQVPARRWASLDEVVQALMFMLDEPAYVTGGILHIDEGRNQV